MPRLSVLICTYNRPDLLTLSLRALLENSEDLPNEIVIVNGGDERADQVVAMYANHPTVVVKLITTVNKNLAASRNVGLPHCTGDLIAMTDDDAEVFPDWVAQMKRAHSEHPDAGAVGGAVIGADADSFVSRLADITTFPNYASVCQVRTVPGVNVSYKRDAVMRVGAQDETLFRGEDVDYNWRVMQLGYKIYFDPAIKVYHHHRPTWRSYVNQHYMYGRAYYLVRNKWREMYCVYPHGFKRPKDFLKAINFFAGVLYEPIWYAFRMHTWSDKILALPLLFVNGVGWRVGMLRQKWVMPKRIN